MTAQSTQLEGYEIWHDGVVTVQPGDVPELLLRGVDPSKIMVFHSSADIDRFNQLNDTAILEKRCSELRINLGWNIPDTYLSMNLHEHVMCLAKKYPEKYQQRALTELEQIHCRGQSELFKTLVFVIDTLNSRNIVWGVGRGSSCASLVLFLIGLHCVDPVKYDIDLEEFFHD